MDAFVKGILQGSIPTIVLVGGTHYLVKGFKVSRPVVYWGSLAVATGLTYAVVQGKIKAPFMNAEGDDFYEDDLEDYGWVKTDTEFQPVCSKCREPNDFSALTKGRCKKCIGNSMNAETFEARENKDGTIVLTENEWHSCLYLYNGNYLYGNKELRLINEGLKSGFKFEIVRTHSQDALKMIHLYENVLRNMKGFYAAK